MKHQLRRSLLALSFTGGAALLLTSSGFAQPAGEFFFHDGDRAMILGDSITQQAQYSTLVESYVYSRFPTWKITFRNTGWSGDTMGLRTRGGQENGFKRDLEPLQPTAVTIDFGMNDGRSGDGGYDGYLASARTLADQFVAIGTRVAFITSSAEERYAAGEPAGSRYNLVLRKYSDGLKTVAQEKNVPFIDQLNPMIETIEAGRAGGVLSATESNNRLIPDGVHPNWPGHLLMATFILKGLKAPALVSNVEIDAKTGNVKADQAKVSEVKTGDALNFTRHDEVMPWPMNQDFSLALNIPRFKPLDDLSRYTLKVTSLPAPKYKIALDGKEIGTFSKEQLSAGINLSREAGAAMPEVTELWNAITAKNQLFYNRWRNVQLFAIPGWLPAAMVAPSQEAELKKLDAQLAVMDAKLNEPRTPKPHQWTLTPA